MMDWTDRHCRFFHRLLNPEIVLYTEMVTTGALLNGDPERFLRYNTAEHPVILQLGGSDPEDLAQAARYAEKYGYDGINLNCGCPSERVQKGAFGACLMAEPDLVAQCIAHMRDSTALPVSIKCRIGIDESDSYEFLEDFVTKTHAAGCDTYIVHARKAWLKGLSPKENREIPPLDYPRVYRLKEEHPDLSIHLNGGICTLEDMTTPLNMCDGVMIGREAYHNPWFLRRLAEQFTPETAPTTSRAEIVIQMMDYAAREYREFDTPLHSITRHMMGLYHGMHGARAWRQHLSNVSRHAQNNPLFVLDFLNSECMLTE